MRFFDDLRSDPWRRRTAIPPFDLDEFGGSVPDGTELPPEFRAEIPASEGSRGPERSGLPPFDPSLAGLDEQFDDYGPLPPDAGRTGYAPMEPPGPAAATNAGRALPASPTPADSLSRLHAARPAAPGASAAQETGEVEPSYAEWVRRNAARKEALARAPAKIQVQTPEQKAFDDQLLAYFRRLPRPDSPADSLANAQALASYAADLNRRFYGGRMGELDIPSTVKSFEAVRRGSFPPNEIGRPKGSLTPRQQAEAEAVRKAAEADGKISQDELDRLAPPTFLQSLGKGEATMRGRGWAGLEAFSEGVGAKRLARWAGGHREYYEAIQNALPKGLPLEKVGSVADALQWVMRVVPEQTPELITGTAATRAGELIGASVGARLGVFGERLAAASGKIGLGAPGYASALGEIQQRNKALDPQRSADLTTLIGAGAVALLDSKLPGRIGSALVSRFGREKGEALAQRTLLLPLTGRLAELAARWSGEVGHDGAVKAVQRGVSELFSAFQTGKDLEPGLLYRILQDGLTGAIISGGKSAGKHAFTEIPPAVPRVRSLRENRRTDPGDGPAEAVRHLEPTAGAGTVSPPSGASTGGAARSRSRAVGGHDLALIEQLQTYATAPDGAAFVDRIRSHGRGASLRAGAALARLPAEQAGRIRSAMLGSLGGGRNFSLSGFASSWSRLDGGRAHLFGSERARDLDRLAVMVRRDGAPDRRSPGSQGAARPLQARQAVIAAADSALGELGGGSLLSAPGLARRLSRTPADYQGARRYWASDWARKAAAADPDLEPALRHLQERVLEALRRPAGGAYPRRRRR